MHAPNCTLIVRILLFNWCRIPYEFKGKRAKPNPSQYGFLSFHRGQVTKFCYHCGRSAYVKLSSCNRCGRVYYCSRSCRLKGWDERHKHECSRITGTINLTGWRRFLLLFLKYQEEMNNIIGWYGFPWFLSFSICRCCPQEAGLQIPKSFPDSERHIELQRVSKCLEHRRGFLVQTQLAGKLQLQLTFSTFFVS